MPNDNAKPEAEAKPVRVLTPAQVALQNTARAARDKKRNRVPSTVVRTILLNFLNSDDFSIVVDWPNKTAKSGQIVQRLKAIVEEDNLGDLVYPTATVRGVELVSMQ